MGTFTHYYGPKQLIPEKKEEFVERALKILRAGGAMGVEPMRLSGDWAYLLKPCDLQEYGYDFTYSCYFEKEYWENAVLDPKTGAFHTNKVGYSIFGQVCFAVYLLREFYEEVSGIAALNGTSPNEQACLGWFKYLFGGEWNNHRIYRIQELYRSYPRWFHNYCAHGVILSKAKYNACTAKPIEMSVGIDRSIFLEMSDDGVCSSSTDTEVCPVSTLDFLNADVDLRLMLPIEGEPGVITDDDRIFWWKPGGDVVVSKSMGKTLSVIRESHQLRQNEQSIDVLATLMRILAEGTKKYNRAFLFESVYWEFVKNQADRNVQAATRLMETILNLEGDAKTPCCWTYTARFSQTMRCGKKCSGFEKRPVKRIAGRAPFQMPQPRV